MSRLNAVVVEVSALSSGEKSAMFALFRANYDGAARAVFDRDLEGKDYVVLLTDREKQIGGFSTLAVYEESYEQNPLRVLYSGDTIIDPAYWGKNEFAMTWLQLAGAIKKQRPEVPLYWLLIVKGHRTYRFLSLFSKEYYPRHDAQTPEKQRRIMNYLARRRFGEHYDPASGLVRLPEPRNFLVGDLARVPEKDLGRAETRFFLSRNPDYASGDELLCLCELEAGNLKRFAREWFLRGMSSCR